MASRGEVDGPRVAECDAALAWWRIRSRLVKEMDITPERAESLLDLIVPQPGAAAETDSGHDGLHAPDSPASDDASGPESPSEAQPVEPSSHSVTAAR